MKGMFEQYQAADEDQARNAWGEALFVFDTNVLLNLHRYRKITQKELLDALTALSNRIWIPYHVALEYNRNRLSVIAEQNRRFHEVGEAVINSVNTAVQDIKGLNIDRKHTVIKAEEFVESLNKFRDELVGRLEILKVEQPKVIGPDGIKSQIDTLFEGRVGDPFADADELAAVQKLAEERFKKKVPPGYRDASKAKSDDAEFVHNGLVFNRAYGDFIIWKQILNHAKNSKIKKLIFVTDDDKEDWWWIVRDGGPKKIGPRPELREEARLEGGVDELYFSTPERFLVYAKEQLKVVVSTATIEEVQDVSAERATVDATVNDRSLVSVAMDRLTRRFFTARTKVIQSNKSSFPDLVVEKDKITYGLEISLVQKAEVALSNRGLLYRRAEALIKRGEFDLFSAVWVAPNIKVAKELNARLGDRDSERPPTCVDIVGYINSDGSNGASFVPLNTLSWMFGNQDFGPIMTALMD